MRRKGSVVKPVRWPVPASERIAREREAMRRQQGSHMQPGQEPDARGMGAETAEYTEPTIDPQWMDAWKMFLDRDGNEYGVPVKVPRGQYFVGGPNALENLRRPDGGHWFTLVEPERLMPEPKFECFVGECTKKLHRRIQLVEHVETFHFTEAKTYEAILRKIKEQVAQDDPRLQRVLASLDTTEEEFALVDETALGCEQCEAVSPPDHENPEAWLRGHRLGAHKEVKDAD